MPRSNHDPFTRAFEAEPFELGDEHALELAKQFAYVLPTQSSIEVIARYSPIVEIGAGTGYWAYMLRAAGADLVAYDHAPLGGSRDNRYHPGAAAWSEVLAGDTSALAAHSDRALLLCWPPLFSELGDVLSSYTGNTIIYIGDRGQRTAWPHDLELRYELIECHPALALDPAPGSPPELSIWQLRE